MGRQFLKTAKHFLTMRTEEHLTCSERRKHTGTIRIILFARSLLIPVCLQVFSSVPRIATLMDWLMRQESGYGNFKRMDRCEASPHAISMKMSRTKFW